MKKKILTIMLSVVLTVTMLVGCGDSVETGGRAERRERESRTSEEEAGDAQNTKVESDNSDDLFISINELPKEWQQRQWLLIHVDGQGKSKAVRTDTGAYTGEYERATLDNLFIVYDEEGEIRRSNIDFRDYPTFDENNNIVYTYEYSDSDLTVISENLDTGKTTSNDYTLTREGRVIEKNCNLIYVMGGRGTGYVSEFTRSKETKSFSYNFVEITNDGHNHYYIRLYSDSTLGSFAVRESNKMTAYGYTADLPTEVIYVTDGKESSCYVKEDEYGNIVMTESDQIFYFTYAYLTMDEYMNYLETGDLEGIKVSGYTGSDYNYESILSDSSEIEKNVIVEKESSQGENNTANGKDTNSNDINEDNENIEYIIPDYLMGLKYCYIDNVLYNVKSIYECPDDTVSNGINSVVIILNGLVLCPLNIESSNLQVEEFKNSWSYQADYVEFIYPGEYISLVNEKGVIYRYKFKVSPECANYINTLQSIYYNNESELNEIYTSENKWEFNYFMYEATKEESCIYLKLEEIEKEEIDSSTLDLLLEDESYTSRYVRAVIDSYVVNPNP